MKGDAEMNEQIELSFAPKTCVVSAAQAAVLQRMIQSLAAFAAQQPGVDPQGIYNGINILAGLPDDAADPVNAPGWEARWLEPTSWAGGTLAVKTPQGGELGVQMDSQRRPHLVSYLNLGEKHFILVGLTSSEGGWALRLTSAGKEATFRLPGGMGDLPWTDGPAYMALGDEPAQGEGKGNEICPHCQAVLSPGARFCRQCGAQLEAGATLPEMAPTQRMDEAGLAELLRWTLVKPDGAEIAVPAGARITIGRMKDNELPIADEKISRHHALVENQAGVIMVSDLGSVNGTLVNGQKISASTPVKNGDLIQVGDCTLVLKAGKNP